MMLDVTRQRPVFTVHFDRGETIAFVQLAIKLLSSVPVPTVQLLETVEITSPDNDEPVLSTGIHFIAGKNTAAFHPRANRYS